MNGALTRHTIPRIVRERDYDAIETARGRFRPEHVEALCQFHGAEQVELLLARGANVDVTIDALRFSF